MKKFTNLLLLLGIIGFFSIKTLAQTVNTPETITWQFNQGTAGQLATYSSGTSGYFSVDWIENGTNLIYKDKSVNFGDTLTRFQPVVSSTNADSTNANLVSFNLRPVSGLSFTPTSISLDCGRYGTDGGLVKIAWKSPDGTITLLQSNVRPNRINATSTPPVYPLHLTYDLSALNIPVSGGDCGLYLYIYNLGNTKQVGLGNIVITGDVKGSIANTTKYNFSLAASPSAGGTVASNPVGTSFDDGTSITVTATRNFGYNFSHWTNNAGDTLSKNNTYTFSISKDTSLYAVFKPVNTYSLSLNCQGGAQTYMLSVSPAGTVVDGQTMYEEGTNVTLTANNNPLLTFNNWLTGETNPVLTVQMTKNQDITAVYSVIDYIAGWDFYKAGGSGRPADFYSTADNQTSSLILRKLDGTTNSWLDKSNVATSTYDGSRGSGVIWKPVKDKYYYQISFNAKDFTTIHVTAGFSYNYNTYTVRKCEYSLDGTNFTTVGTYTMPAVKTWYDNTFALPADADHAEKVYVRWIADTTSSINGTSAPDNDGTSISNIYVTAKAAVNNDGTPPVLSSSVPAGSSTNASATGKIVLTFDEKVMLATGSTGVATLGSKQLTPAVSGKTITFPYSGLEYNTQYTFTLPANSLSDLSGNTLTSPLTISFTTMARPTVTKKVFDFVVGVDGDFKAALAAATTASTTGERFRIFFPKGEYNIGALTGDGNQKTTITLSNLSLIGEKDSSVVLYNKPTAEGISVTATLAFTNTANNIYMQDMTLLNKLDYRAGSFAGRAAALQDHGTKNIYKNVHLLSNQDTYYSGSGRTYFEEGSIHGTVDFICGGGDVFFNECLLYLEERTGNCITAPATSSSWGYVFSNCKIDGFATANGNFSLGRPWQNSPRSVYINTKMNILPSAAGWAEMGVAPALFAEYNSTTMAGATVDLSNRKTTYTSGNVYVNPVLTKDQADQYTLENVLGGSDTWQPKLYTEQAPVPVVTLDNRTLKWDDSNYVLCWAIFKDDTFVKFVTTNSYAIPFEVTSATYMVRAANEMGGLSIGSNKVIINLVPKLNTEITWNAPQAITYGTPLSDTQLNATAVGNTSTAAYNPAKGVVLPAGTQNLTVTFAEDANYNAASKTVSIVVNKASSEITWANPADIVTGTALNATQLNATVTGTTGTATYTPSLGTVLPVGTHTLTVTFSADANFEAATRSVTIKVTNPLSVETWTDDNVTIYPNPADRLIKIKVPSFWLGSALTITTINGEVIISEILSKEVSEISLENLPAGTYLCKVSSEKNSMIKQIIKK